MDRTREGVILDRIRAHCDNGIRYFTWALARMPSIPEQADYVPHVENARSALAMVLAFIEGATDERDAMLHRGEIVERYVRLVADEDWQPSFGSARSPSE